MRVVIQTEGPFPSGMAATTRLLTYARGMIEAGAEVTVLCTKPSEAPLATPVNTVIEGSFEGIRFKYTPGTTQRSSSSLIRLFHYYKGFYNGKKELRRMMADSPVDVLFMGISSFWFTWSYYRWTRRNHVLFVQERSEYPFIGVRGLSQQFKLWFYLRVTCRLFDAIIVITNALESYFAKWIRKDAVTYLLPMLVEFERFALTKGKPETLPEKYIAYVGNMQGSKDGVPVLIEAFAGIADAFPDVHLVLIGDTGFRGFENLQEMIEKRRLSERVHFPGRIERENLPLFLAGASCLALARPSSKQAEGGFPNKLGEYLATGKPVVITSVGEIPRFLSDGENAFVSVPDDARAFAVKLKEALEDPARAGTIGEQGQKLAQTIFDPKLQAEKMLAFFAAMKKVY